MALDAQSSCAVDGISRGGDACDVRSGTLAGSTSCSWATLDGIKCSWASMKDSSSEQELETESYSDMLASCLRAGDLPGAESVLKLMEATPWETDELCTESYNAVINLCVRVANYDKALEYHSRMEEANIMPNVMTYNLLLNACATSGQAASAEALLARMTEQGLKPDVVTYGTICKAFAREGRVDKIEGVMRQLEAAGNVLNEYFFATLISACADCAPPDTARAEQAFRELVRRGLRPLSVRKALGRVLGEERATELVTETSRRRARGGAARSRATEEAPTRRQPAWRRSEACRARA